MINETTPAITAFDGEPPPFELLAHENGFRFWLASDLAKALGYEDTLPLKKALNKAMAVCASLNIDIYGNFEQLPQTNPPDYKLSRFACYLTVMNANVRHPMVARSQVYFASLAENIWKTTEQQSEVERLVVRGELSEAEKSLASTAHKHQVEDYVKFHNAGYLGMYNMNLWQLEKYKGFEGKKPLLDHMGRDELAANLFRLASTETKIQKEGILGQANLEAAANTVGRIVRQAMLQISQKKPEDLPLALPIKEAQKSIKATQRNFKKLDHKTKP